jgi:hypothetical protein
MECGATLCGRTKGAAKTIGATSPISSGRRSQGLAAFMDNAECARPPIGVVEMPAESERLANGTGAKPLVETR